MTIDRCRGRLLPAQPVAVLVDVAENVLEALAADHVHGRPARDAFGGRAPVGDAAVDVAHVDAVAQALQDAFGRYQRAALLKHLPCLHGLFSS